MKIDISHKIVMVFYDYEMHLNDVVKKDDIFMYALNERFEKEILSLDGVTEVNTGVDKFFYCHEVCEDDVISHINENFKKWINDEINERIDFWEECNEEEPDQECIDKINMLKKCLC
jgi:hypothetical protein